MSKVSRTLPILMADDDAADCLLTQKAMEESRLADELYFFEYRKQFLVVLLPMFQHELDNIRRIEFGLRSSISKPVTFRGLVETIDGIGRDWLDLVNPPPPSLDF